MERMTMEERINAERGIQRAIKNGFKKEEVKNNRGLIILAIIVLLFNIVTLQAGSVTATICGVLFATVMVAFIWYLDIM